MRLHTLRGMKADDYALHSHAFIELIFADIVDAGKWYTNYSGCSRK
jgi:hypothetical protein